MTIKKTAVDELLERCEDLGRFGEYDYSWSEFGAWYDPQARIYYWYDDSGCSCNGFMDYVTSVGELSVGRKEELTAAAKDAGNDKTDGWLAFMSNLRNHKESAA